MPHVHGSDRVYQVLFLIPFGIAALALLGMGASPWVVNRRTVYGITDRRVLILRQWWGRKQTSVFVESAPDLRLKAGDPYGSIYFTSRLEGLQAIYPELGPALKRIANPDYVFALLAQRRGGQALASDPYADTSPLLAPRQVPARIARTLQDGETVLWTGRPDRWALLHASDIYLIPFSLAWGLPGIYVFASWIKGVIGVGPPAVYPWPVLPFTLAALYLLVGRFPYAWLSRSVAEYAVTNRRVIEVSPLAWTRAVPIAIPDLWLVSLVISPRGKHGTVAFTDTWIQAVEHRKRTWSRPTRAPLFQDMQDADAAYRLVTRLRMGTQDAGSPA